MSQPTRLATSEQLAAILADPVPQWIFKHSATCSISAAAHEEFLAYLQAHPAERAHLLVVQDSRAVSNEIATRLGQVHQSPQALLVAGGKMRWSASHWSITAQALAAARQAAA